MTSLVSTEVKWQNGTLLMWEKCNQGQSIPLCHMQCACWGGSKGVQTDLFCWEKMLWLNFTEWRICRPVLAGKGDLLDIQKNTITWETGFQAVSIFSGLQCHQVFQANRAHISSVDRNSWILIPFLHIHVSVDVASHAFLSF